MRRGIGDLLATKKLEKGLAEDDLAEMFGVSQATVNRWVTGQNVPTRPYWPAIARFVGLTQREVADLCVADKRGRSPSGMEARLDLLEGRMADLHSRLGGIERSLAHLTKLVNKRR